MSIHLINWLIGRKSVDLQIPQLPPPPLRSLSWLTKILSPTTHKFCATCQRWHLFWHIYCWVWLIGRKSSDLKIPHLPQVPHLCGHFPDWASATLCIFVIHQIDEGRRRRFSCKTLLYFYSETAMTALYVEPVLPLSYLLQTNSRQLRILNSNYRTDMQKTYELAHTGSPSSPLFASLP